LVEELAEELRSGREFGQPIVDEDRFKTGAIRVVVLWDRWEDVDPEDRSAAIVEAYRLVEGEEFASRIALVNGLTIPEAMASGMLPVMIFAAVREKDPVSLESCNRAMIEEGASTLLDPGNPELRFSTEEEAMACVRRLSARLPGSEQCWFIINDHNNKTICNMNLLN